ncbi:MAG TPA: metallophosphoesterase [Anaerolineaceae bacterium]|nr:metallophosphoesterase [Anaerolineaceae bacterium]
MKILSVSDVELGFIYSPLIIDRFKDVDLVISCGDLPYYYLEFIISLLNVPLYYVRGNHASPIESGSGGDRSSPWGAIDLHQKARRAANGLLLAGIEGSVRYNLGPYQYSQGEMWWMVWKLVPGLFLNKLRFGRYLDIFVSHAPPWQIHDKTDLPHQGIKAFRWLIDVFQPAYHLHGHIHVYRQDEVTESLEKNTWVVNSYGYRVLVLDMDTIAQRITIHNQRRAF